MHTSDTFVIAKGIAPAALIQDITSASSGPLTSLLQYRPAVWDNPVTWIQSLVEKGTPRKGVSFSISSTDLTPDWINSSTLHASSNASLNLSSTTQFRIGFTSFILAINVSTTSLLVTFLVRILWAIAVAVSSSSRFWMGGIFSPEPWYTTQNKTFENTSTIRKTKRWHIIFNSFIQLEDIIFWVHILSSRRTAQAETPL